MSEPTRYPLPGTEHLVERLPAPPAGARARRWVLRDDNGQHYHGVVPLAESPAVLELLWKAAADAPEHPVGVYRLHLPELLAADHVRFDREGEPGGGVRVRFYRGAGGVVYLQSRADRPSLAVGQVGAAAGAGRRVPA